MGVETLKGGPFSFFSFFFFLGGGEGERCGVHVKYLFLCFLGFVFKTSGEMCTLGINLFHLPTILLLR